jgi:hypothetical protein
MQNFTFSEVPKYFSDFYSLMLIYSIGKENVKLKKLHGLYPSEPVCFYSTSGPAHLCKPVTPFSSPGSLPSEPRCLTNPTCQSHFFAGGYRSASNPIWRPVPSQTYRLPLLQLHITHRRNFGRPVTLEPCPSAASLRARCCAVWPHRAPRRLLTPHHERTVVAPGAEGSPTNHGRDWALMCLLGCR